MSKSEIRDSTKLSLLEKVRKHDFGKYLLKASIEKIRGFKGEDVSFDFPVTAIIGPNGSGKSSVLGVAGCAYKKVKPGVFFPKSAIGDESMSGWKVDYEIVDKSVNPRQTLRRNSKFRQAKWVRGDVLDRDVFFFGIERTVPAGEKPRYKKLTRSTYNHTGGINDIEENISKQIEHILGKSVSGFKVADIEQGHDFFIGLSGDDQYSEFHFGAGESSIIRMVTAIESAPMNSLILIEEIENGLHPVATRRMVEYLIDVAERKSIQTVFTSHSDFSLEPLPNEAIWACINGKVRQGKLDVEALRAVSGRVDKEVAIFVEDEFAKNWVEYMLRSDLSEGYNQVEVHAVAGDGNAVKTHINHCENPAIKTKSLCVIDGDSEQSEDIERGVIRLPGKIPEMAVFSDVYKSLDVNLAILTVACQCRPEQQEKVMSCVESVLKTNRDPHVIFSRLGIDLGFIPESVIRGAFLSLWININNEYTSDFSGYVRKLVDNVR